MQRRGLVIMGLVRSRCRCGAAISTSRSPGDTSTKHALYPRFHPPVALCASLRSDSLFWVAAPTRRLCPRCVLRLDFGSASTSSCSGRLIVHGLFSVWDTASVRSLDHLSRFRFRLGFVACSPRSCRCLWLLCVGVISGRVSARVPRPVAPAASRPLVACVMGMWISMLHFGGGGALSVIMLLARWTLTGDCRSVLCGRGCG